MLELKRAIDVRGALSINVITMIGIGPLVTIPLVIAALGGPLALVGWIAGAIVALCDGLVWAELASAFPGSGGTYVYLRNIFGPNGLGRALAFLFNWQFLLYAPCLLASGYIGFANYAAYLYPSIGNNAYIHDALAVAIGIVTILLLYRRTAQVATLGAILAVVATLTVAIVAVAGLSQANFTQILHLGAPLRLGVGFLAGFAAALYITLYDYVGYADAALLGDEVVRPDRTIPLAIVLSVIIVAALYVLLQIGVLGAVPWRSLLDAHGQPTVEAQYVGALVVQRAWGRLAALGVTVAVLATAFASLYGNLLGFSRISFAAARDGAFFAVFGRLHPSKEIPHVALLVVGGLSLIASLFTLDQVIAFLTAGIVLIQGVTQIVALALLRTRRNPARFRMPLYPLPALIALVGWTIAFIGSGVTAIALGSAWLAIGTIVFLAAAWRQRWWPFALAAVVVFAVVAAPTFAVSSSQESQRWSNWDTSRVTSDHGYPVFSVEGRPYFPYGAAFFYERIPRDRWRASLLAYKALGINTIDLYCIWNWHAPEQGVLDFNGATDPRRDLVGLLNITHELGFKLILRPGPVIRNEWRNGGYPGWLLERPPYHMPLHDVLEARYPATATLQNRHADAAAGEWLANTTHLDNAAAWLREVLRAVEPYSHDVLAIALDDDQGAYLDNDTWPAPHWHAYVRWLRQTVQSVTGTRVPLFINTYEMKVPAAAPAWAWGNWYQSNSYRLNAHDLADLDFATGLLQTQARFPVMQSEFQAGWLQGADEGVPRPSDPANTALALGELLRDGAHGIVNFPVQDTIDPHGWEAPWANWSYAWDAALTVDLHASPRYGPTRAVGDVVRRYGALLARTHVAADAAIVWAPTLFAPGTLSNADFDELASSTIALQRTCNARGVTCELVDLAALDPPGLRRNQFLLALPPGFARRMTPRAARMLTTLRTSGRLFLSLEGFRGTSPYRGVRNVTLLTANDSRYGFVVAIDPDAVRHHIPSRTVRLRGRSLKVAGFDVAAGSMRVIPVGVSAPKVPAPEAPATGTPPPFADPGGTVISNSHLRVVFAPFAGARIAELGDGSWNAATGIGLLRDAVDPAPPASSRDYIRSYTHPIAAGTFNRAYLCNGEDVLTTRRVSCSYDAPDVPRGGAVFQRTLTLTGASTDLIVGETFVPHDVRSTERLESISGFAFVAGDRLYQAQAGDALGILHDGRLAMLRWRRSDVARIELRRTRGAEIAGLIFARRSVELRLGLYHVHTAAEARTLLDSAPPQ
ncbi:MAG: amino acid permease [Candidatus Eremiobacteraeota bacterium]|nr:amino acid permease [Candidatus Eremiobacteraeota bacterium]